MPRKDGYFFVNGYSLAEPLRQQSLSLRKDKCYCCSRRPRREANPRKVRLAEKEGLVPWTFSASFFFRADYSGCGLGPRGACLAHVQD